MEASVIVLSLLVLVLAFVVILLWLRRPHQKDNFAVVINQQIESLRAQLTSIIESVNRQLESSTAAMLSSQKTIGERLEGANRVVSDVSRALGSLEQATARIFEVAKDIAGLQEILRAPKLRGTMGELFLGDLLSQILPSGHFKLQHKFNSGEVVDAVIQLGEGIVPIDSKFPLENLRKTFEAQDESSKKSFRKKFISDVKKHIDTISSKYIQPEEGTFDFALMYIPAENVYYEVLMKDEAPDEEGIFEYALSKRVIPTSPSTFYAYLQSILLGLRGMKIEKDSKLVLQQIQQLKDEFRKFLDDFDVLGKHIYNTKDKYEESDRKVKRLSEKLTSIGEKEEVRHVLQDGK